MNKRLTVIMAVMLIGCLLILGAAGISMNNDSTATLADSSDAMYLDTVFDQDRVTDIYITLSEADYEDMIKNASQEEYKEATVTINGKKVEQTGFRTKGNSSLNSVANSDSKRFSFKLEFDHYIDGQSLDGLNKINLNNGFSDPSYMREYLSYELLAEMGIPTPACSYANVYINGKLIGLYLAVEDIGESFLQRNYGSSYGNLYKGEGGQGSDLVYSDDNITSYAGLALKTEKKNDTDEKLLAMLKALNSGKNLDKYLNVDEILRYFAVNTVLVNMDSYQGNFKHNYYLYEEDGVFSILPWDYNMSFGGFGGGGNSSTGLYIDQPVSGTSLEERPLLGKLLEVPEYKALYHKYIDEFTNGPFALEKMQARISKIDSLIKTDVENDPSKFYTLEQYEQAIDLTVDSNSETETALVQPSADDNKQTQSDQQADRGRQRGGEMQGAQMALAKFISQRIENVAGQLNGDLPAAGSAEDQGSKNNTTPQPGNQPPEGMNAGGGGNPPGDWQPPDGKAGLGNPPDNMQAGGDKVGFGKPPQGMQPGGGQFDVGQMKGRQDKAGGKMARDDNGLQEYSPDQLYLLGGSLVLLLAVVILLLKKRTKYSI